jgi:hypothetical protein
VQVLRYGGRAMRRGVQRDWMPISIAAVIWILGASLLFSRGVDPLKLSSIQTNLRLYFISLVLLGLIITAKHLFKERPERPISFLSDRIIEGGALERLLSNIPLILTLAAFTPIFSAFKAALPLFNDFGWDETFIRLDLIIHGTDPWRILQPVLGHPLITFALSWLYQVWMLLIYVGSLYFALFVRNEHLRRQYFIAFFLIWSILGMLAATYFASVGPCFMLILKGNPHFIELTGYLHTTHESHHLIGISIQEFLIRAYLVKNYELGAGITAMPSMHVSLAFLVFLGVRQINKRMGWFFGIYAFVIFLGSVHLSFHYAVDGYASIAGTFVIWILAGYLARWAERGSRKLVDPVAETALIHPAR